MSNIALYEKIDNPVTMQSVREMGSEYAKSGFFGITNQSQGLVMAVTCIAENMTPVEFGKTYHIIEGKLSMKADAMLAKFQESGGRVTWKRTDAEECESVFFHKDYCPEGVAVRVTLAELEASGVATTYDKEKKQKVLKTNYQKFPRQMLRARAISEGVRMVNPSIVAGYYTPEEVSDFDDKPARNNGPLPTRRKMQEEPKEAESRVVDTEPAGAAEAEMNDALLAANESAINLYLTGKLKWIIPGQTWRDLKSEHLKQVNARITNFIKTAKEYAETQKEAVNA